MPDGVEFCATAFDAEPILSREPLWDADIGDGYDLIWSGSLLTHFPADAVGTDASAFRRLRWRRAEC